MNSIVFQREFKGNKAGPPRGEEVRVWMQESRSRQDCFRNPEISVTERRSGMDKRASRRNCDKQYEVRQMRACDSICFQKGVRVHLS